MTILAIQKQYTEMYRIRLGEKSGNAPRSLTEQIRVTSKNPNVVKEFAEVYGGNPRRWTDGGGFQVYLPVVRLPIVLLPGQPIVQHMELWGGSSCLRRCDGFTMENGDVCKCGPDAPIEARDCKPVTRLTVVAPDVKVVGVGVLTTRSLIAARELKGQKDLIQAILDSGRPIRGTIRVDTLTGVERRFPVVRLELEGLSYAEVAEAARQRELGAADAPALEAGKEEDA